MKEGDQDLGRTISNIDCTHSEDDEYNIQYQVFSNETLNMSSLQSTLINDCI